MFLLWKECRSWKSNTHCLLCLKKSQTNSKLEAHILIWYIIADILLILCCLSEVSAEFSSLVRTFCILLIQNRIGKRVPKFKDFHIMFSFYCFSSLHKFSANDSSDEVALLKAASLIMYHTDFLNTKKFLWLITY